MTTCKICGKRELLPYKCSYCGEWFCSQHRLPEQHNCPAIRYATSPKEVDFEPSLQRSGYTHPKHLSFQNVGFIKTEAFQFALAVLLVLAVGYSFTAYNVLSPTSSIIAIGFVTSFLVHELAHKLSARRYGIYAEFKLSPLGAFLTAISLIPLLPIKFIAPGAVHLFGFVSRELMGRIALPGPLSNLMISMALLTTGLLGISRYITYSLALANAWIAFFNLLPFEPFDGAKVMRWSFKVWVLMFVLALSLFVIPTLRF